MSNVGAYNYKVITGLTTTINTEIGATYAIILTASLKPSTANELYLTPSVDGGRIPSQVIQGAEGGKYRSMTVSRPFTATSNSHTIAGQVAAGNPAATSVDVLNGAVLIVFRIS